MGIYLDHAATSYPKPDCVCTDMLTYMRDNGTSPGRGNYARAMEADGLVYRTRKALCKLLGVGRPRQIVFTSNATESLNMALKGMVRPGDTVVTTGYEHNALWRPLKTMERDRGVHIETIPAPGAGGYLDLDWLRSRLGQGGVSLVAVAHGSNVIGCITPLAQVCAIAREAGVPVVVDAAQTAGVYPLHVEEMGVDLFAFTGHKGLLGPTGTGGLYIREGLALPTFKEGGTGAMSQEPYMPDDLPDRFEAGTMNIVGLAGLCASAGFLLETGVDTVRAHEVSLLRLLLEGLRDIPRIAVYGPQRAEERLGLVSILLEGQVPDKVSHRLDREFGIMVRAGLHCAPQAHRLLGTEATGTVRISVGYSTTPDDIRALLDALRAIV